MQVKEYLKFPSKAPYAWFVDIFTAFILWIIVLIGIFLVYSYLSYIHRYDGFYNYYMQVNDLKLLWYFFLIPIISIIVGFVQISYNVIQLLENRSKINIRKILMNLLIVMVILPILLLFIILFPSFLSGHNFAEIVNGIGIPASVPYAGPL